VTGSRADHFARAEELVGLAVAGLKRARAEVDDHQARHPHSAGRYDLDLSEATFYLRAAEVHAMLATAGPGVEQELRDRERRDVVPERSQRERQAGRPPLAGRAPTAPVLPTLQQIARGFNEGAERMARKRAAAIPVVAPGPAFTRADDCAETNYDRYGDCDGPVVELAQVGTSFGLVLGCNVLLCQSHADQALKFKRARRKVPASLRAPRTPDTEGDV
jgi:hypothetical protein